MSAAQARAVELWQREVPSGSWKVRSLRGGLFEVTTDDGEVVGVVDTDTPQGSVMHTLPDPQLQALWQSARLHNPASTALIFEGRLRVRCTNCGCTSWCPADINAQSVQAAFCIGSVLGPCRGCQKPMTIVR